MEIKARYRLIGLFMLIVIGMGFGFVYWLQNAASFSERNSYRIRFSGTIGGLQVGAPVMFNGLRVGEVTGLAIDADNPHQIIVLIGVEKSTPMRADTSVRIDYQGLMGSAAIALSGGSPNLPKLNTMVRPPELAADPSAGEGLSDMARRVLTRVDKVFADDSGDLHDTIANLKTFSAALAKNSNKIDTILGGLEKTFAAPAKPVVTIFDLSAPTDFPVPRQQTQTLLVIADLKTIPTFDTQQLITKPKNGPATAIAHAQWSDTVPKLIQEKLVQTFENAHYLGAVSLPIDQLSADYQLLIDLRAFDVTGAPEHAEIEFTARILAKNGKIVGARLFHADAPTATSDAAGAAQAMNEVFGKTARDLVAWTAPLVFDTPAGKGKSSENKSE